MVDLGELRVHGDEDEDAGEVVDVRSKRGGRAAAVTDARRSETSARSLVLLLLAARRKTTTVDEAELLARRRRLRWRGSSGRRGTRACGHGGFGAH